MPPNFEIFCQSSNGFSENQNSILGERTETTGVDNRSICLGGSGSGQFMQPREQGNLGNGQYVQYSSSMGGSEAGQGFPSGRPGGSSGDTGNQNQCKLVPVKKSFGLQPAQQILGRMLEKYSIQTVLLRWVESTIITNISQKPELETFEPSPTALVSIMFNKYRVSISNIDYIKRHVNYGNYDNMTFIYALIYLERVARRYSELPLLPQSFHRLFSSALPIAAKFFQDQVFPMYYYQKIAGIPNAKEMNRLERAFLKFIDFNLYVSPEELEQFVKNLFNIVEDADNTMDITHDVGPGNCGNGESIINNAPVHVDPMSN